jgi:hypothetical protein
MNPFTRVAIIANFVLALGFALASFVLYAKQVNWAQSTARLNSANNALQTENTRLKASTDQEIGNLQGRIAGLEKENAQLKEMANAANAMAERLSTELGDAKTAIAAMTTTAGVNSQNLANAEAEKKALQDETKNLKEQIRVAAAKENKAQRVATEASADSVLLQEQIQRLTAQVHELMLQNEDLNGMVAIAEQQIPGLRQQGGGTLGPGVFVAGYVMKIDLKDKLVVVNVGERNEVRVGMELAIAREGTFMGKLRITKVNPEMSVGRILDITPDAAAIKVGDLVTTL